MSASATVRHAEVRLSSGTRLHYVEHGATDGEPILFLHGWPDSWFSFSRVMPLLPPDARAIALDQRGFGDSDRPDSGYAISDMADDVVGFLEALAIGRAALVGHSFGSFVARQAVMKQPGRVSALILIGTGFTASNVVTRDVQDTLRSLPDPIPVTFARDFQAGTIFRPIPPEFFERLIAESLKLPARLWRVLFDRLLEHDDTRDLARITAPTLLLWGDRDALFPRVDQDRVKAAMPGAQLTVYDETGHCPNWERPELVARDIAGFLRQHRVNT